MQEQGINRPESGDIKQIPNHKVFQSYFAADILNIVAVDKTGRIIYATSAELNSLGFSPEEYIGKQFQDFYNDENIIAFIKSSLLHTTGFLNTESVVYRKDGFQKHVIISAKNYSDETGTVYTYFFIRDITSYKKNENLLSYLNSATEELSAARDTREALDKISRLIVPKFADWFNIDLYKNNKVELLLMAHQDPEKVKWAYKFREKFPIDLATDQGTAYVVKTGRPLLVPVITGEMIRHSIQDEVKAEMAIEIGMRSIIQVAMFNKDQVSGVITFASTAPGKQYDETDLRFAQNFAGHIAHALENARLNEDAQAEIQTRTQVEEELLRTRKQLNSALLSGLVGTWVRDLKRGILFPDESLSRMFDVDYYPQGCYTDIFTSRIHPGDLEKSQNIRRNAIETRTDYEAEYRVVAGDGAIRWMFARGRTEYDEAGEPDTFSGTVVDITARKLAEEALKSSEELYKAIVDNASIGITLGNLQSKFIEVNPVFCTITGYSREELLSSSFGSITHLDDREENARLLAQLVAGEVLFFILEKRYYHKKGWIIWVRNTVSLIKDAAGNPSQTIAFTEDITERKQAQAALKESEERFRVIAETLPQKIFVTDNAGASIYLNPQWELFTGYSLEEIHRLTLGYFIHPDDLDENLKAWWKAVETGDAFEYEHRFLHKSGEYYWQLTRALPVRDDAGKIFNWIGSITDIQDQKLNEEKKDEFISIASHELKTPITTLKGYLQIIQKISEREEYKDIGLFLPKTAKQIDKLTALVNDLLNVSKIQAGKLDYHFTEFELQEIIEDALSDAKNNFPDYFVAVSGDKVMKLYGDKFRLEQVLSNLISNAAKYSPDEARIELNIKHLGDEVTFSVKDYGVGIPEDKKQYVFDRFYRVENTSYRFTGLGIGLYIAAQIIKRHHGKIWFESEPEKGSTFYFSLPLKQ